MDKVVTILADDKVDLITTISILNNKDATTETMIIEVVEVMAVAAAGEATTVVSLFVIRVFDKICHDWQPIIMQKSRTRSQLCLMLSGVGHFHCFISFSSPVSDRNNRGRYGNNFNDDGRRGGGNYNDRGNREGSYGGQSRDGGGYYNRSRDGPRDGPPRNSDRPAASTISKYSIKRLGFWIYQIGGSFSGLSRDPLFQPISSLNRRSLLQDLLLFLKTRL